MAKSKKCSKCRSTRVLSKFSKRAASKDGLTARCTKCLLTKAMKVRFENPELTRVKNLKSRFNMSIDNYNTLYLRQGGACAICSKAETMIDKRGKVKYLAVDHDHSTGKVRGLLCNACNTGIGKLGDSIKVLKSAVKYLNKRGSYGEK